MATTAADVDVDIDVSQARARNDLALKSRFEAIFTKYGRDFDDEADEIDLQRGIIVVDRGHVQHMPEDYDPSNDTVDAADGASATMTKTTATIEPVQPPRDPLWQVPDIPGKFNGNASVSPISPSPSHVASAPASSTVKARSIWAVPKRGRPRGSKTTTPRQKKTKPPPPPSSSSSPPQQQTVTIEPEETADSDDPLDDFVGYKTVTPARRTPMSTAKSTPKPRPGPKANRTPQNKPSMLTPVTTRHMGYLQQLMSDLRDSGNDDSDSDDPLSTPQTSTSTKKANASADVSWSSPARVQTPIARRKVPTTPRSQSQSGRKRRLIELEAPS